jgi:hypothetical protein
MIRDAVVNINLLIGFNTQILNLLDLTNPADQPKHFGNLRALYKNCFVQGVKLTIQLSNIAAQSFTAVLAECPASQSALVTLKDLIDMPRSQYKLCIPNGNKSVVTFRKSESTSALVGKNISQLDDYWMMNGSPPTVSDVPVLILGYQTTNPGLAISGNIALKIEYHIQWFTLNPQ